jgi:seryl-tRNA synthetase
MRVNAINKQMKEHFKDKKIGHIDEIKAELNQLKSQQSEKEHNIKQFKAEVEKSLSKVGNIIH